MSTPVSKWIAHCKAPERIRDVALVIDFMREAADRMEQELTQAAEQKLGVEVVAAAKERARLDSASTMN